MTLLSSISPLSSLGFHHQTSQDYFPPNSTQSRARPLRERQIKKEVLLGRKERESFIFPQQSIAQGGPQAPKSKQKRRNVMPPGVGGGGERAIRLQEKAAWNQKAQGDVEPHTVSLLSRVRGTSQVPSPRSRSW